jgi:hypothetical protein
VVVQPSEEVRGLGARGGQAGGSGGMFGGMFDG